MTPKTAVNLLTWYNFSLDESESLSGEMLYNYREKNYIKLVVQTIYLLQWDLTEELSSHNQCYLRQQMVLEWNWWISSLHLPKVFGKRVTTLLKVKVTFHSDGNHFFKVYFVFYLNSFLKI
jgi:hypothetical protein